jgi:hypothetical protein
MLTTFTPRYYQYYQYYVVSANLLKIVSVHFFLGSQIIGWAPVLFTIFILHRTIVNWRLVIISYPRLSSWIDRVEFVSTFDDTLNHPWHDLKSTRIGHSEFPTKGVSVQIWDTVSFPEHRGNPSPMCTRCLCGNSNHNHELVVSSIPDCCFCQRKARGFYQKTVSSCMFHSTSYCFVWK